MAEQDGLAGGDAVNAVIIGMAGGGIDVGDIVSRCKEFAGRTALARMIA